MNGHWGQSLKAPATRPNLVRSVENDRYDRNLQMTRENGCSSAQRQHLAVNGPFSFREQDEDLLPVQCSRRNLHGLDQICVRVNDRDVATIRQPASGRTREHSGFSERYGAPDKTMRQRAEQKRRVEIALVIGTEHETALVGKILQPVHVEADQDFG